MKDQFIKQSNAVADNIREIRKFRNYSQDFVADKIGITQNAYSKIELGHSRITLERFFELAMILGVEATKLISFNAEDLIFVLRQSELPKARELDGTFYLLKNLKNASRLKEGIEEYKRDSDDFPFRKR